MTQVTLRAYQEEIDHLIDEARFLEAFAHLRHILSQYPRYAEAYYLLGKTMLEADLPQLAVDIFRRVIVANPEHLLARAGLGEAHMQLDNLNAAIWNLERTFELSPGDPDLAEVLRRLYGRRDGAEPAHIPLTRAALARLYLRANLYGRAADELRPLLDKEPQRVDLQLALAEAYWRDGQVVQAADACQKVLDQLPYCLKANLLLGDLWLTSGQEEGERYLKRAQEVDPEGVLAQEILGPTSSVPAQEVTLERLTYKPEAVEGDRSAEWFKRLEAASATVGISEAIPEMTAGEMQLVDLTASLETQIQIPDWLRDLGAGGEEAGLGGFDWMGVAVTEAGPAEAGEREAAVPDWLREFEAQAGVAEGVAPPEAAEAPDWLSAFQAAPAAPAAEITEAVPPVEEGVPDWLRELQPEAAGEEISTQELPMAPAEGIPEWLRELQPPAAAPAAAVPAEAEGLPDWLRGLQPPAAAGEAAPAVEGEAFPAWPEEAPSPAQAAEEEIPSAELPAVEEAIPEWLKAMQPSAAVTGGMEEEEETATLELPAMEEAIPEWLQAMQPPAAITEEEEETATLELPAAEEALPDWLQAAPPAAVVEAAPAAPAEEGLPDWLREFQPPAEAAPAAELPPTPAGEGVPEWLRELQLPPEAPEAPTSEAEAMFGWLSFGGETTEVETPPAVPSRAELAEPVELAEPTEEAPAPVQEAATPEAFFGWMAFGPEVTEVAAPVAEVPPPPAPVTEAAPAAPPPAEEGLLSGDDALAWLASLTVGKEEELRAQAEAEAQVRVAEILGRKPAEVAPPPAPAPVAEVAPPPAPVEIAAPPVEVPPPAPVAEAAPAAPPPAEEGLLSGDDALAWLASLTVGKEEELRAQAEAEAQVRVAEILGRKPAEVAPPAPAPVAEVPPPPAPVEIAAPLVEVPPPAPVAEAAPAAPPPAEEGLLSGDDALAWLASLTVGKEEELRAQAEAEAQVRVAEILGRKPAEVAPPPAPAPVAEVPPPAPVPVVAAPPVEVPPPAPVAEAAPAAPALAEEGLLSGDDALAWLASLTVGKEEELRAQAEAEAQVRVAEILGRKPAEVAPPPAPAPVAEVPPPAPVPVVAAPPVEEVTPLPPPAVEAAPAVPFAPEKEVTPPVVEVPPPTPVVKAAPPVVETPPPPAPAVEAAPVVPPAAKVTPPPARKPTPPPPAAEETRPAPARPKPAPRPPTPPVTPPAAVPAAGLEALREQVKVHKNDHEARLALARALWAANETEEALSHYTRLIRAKMLMREVFTDLERYIQERPRIPQLWRTLGDAYMKDGQMNKAMETYNQAMNLL